MREEGTRTLFRGAMHAHTRFSDGTENVEHWVRRGKDAGLDFLAMSDHAECFDDERMREYVQSCRRASDAGFLVIPGLEFSFFRGKIHILGYGIEERPVTDSAADLVRAIQRAGGIAVLAHPRPEAADLLDGTRKALDGVEVWNGRYDGHGAPNIESIQLLRRLRGGNQRMVACAGLDLHRPEDWGDLFVEVEAPRLEAAGILDALKGGNFHISGGNGIRIPPSSKLRLRDELGIVMRRMTRRRRKET